MATIVLSAVGLTAGNAIGGSVLGLSTGVLGRAIGATIGRVIDNRILGQGAEPIETGILDRFRLTGASEGADIGSVFGRMRVPGQVIWATRYLEKVSESGGGKGAPPRPKTREFSYCVSFAVALCEGEISGVLRVWADGQPLDLNLVNMRVYRGTGDQLPDPKIEAVEGIGEVPAYRCLAYVVFEDFELGPSGNRIPQLTFEVVRPAPDGLALPQEDVAKLVKGVALIPGTGEYALATTPVHYNGGLGQNTAANVSAPGGKTDLLTSLDGLAAELPNSKSTMVVVSWFGNDLRCGLCDLKPKVEHKLGDGVGMPWTVSGLTRSQADEIAQVDDRPIYGGTPTDQSVIEAIVALKVAGQAVSFYPFILMEQLAGNGQEDPWTGADDQPELPWRGRITLSKAPGQAGSPDQTAAADTEVSAFFGSAGVSDFVPGVDSVGYSGPAEWSYRRMVLHYAHLCALAGGIDAFCIGSEMRSLTQIRGANNSFPAVDALRTLAQDVRSILGPQTKIGYAADWSEYFGYHPQDGSGDVFFHLDPLWGDANVDFVGVDNYMPISDWRDGDDHADADWGSIYNSEYLQANIEGGEGYDWYYVNASSRELQLREPISDGAYGEPWVYRYKDLRNWWLNDHHNRVGGIRDETPTDWEPQSKPIWFTEFGCAAIDKGTNQPNKFLDPKSSESDLPYFSSGRRDDFIQSQYLRAMMSFWEDGEKNPVSDIYGGPMIDLEKAHAWAWDARPFPNFPGNSELWSDGENYLRGHWLNGRGGNRSLAGVVAEICELAGISDYDVSELWGVVRGFAATGDDTGRATLQPLMLAFGFDVIERNGKLIFRSRDGRTSGEIDAERLAVIDAEDGDLQLTRAPEAEMAGRVRLNFIEAEGDYAVLAEEAIFPDEATNTVSQSELPLVLTHAEAKGIVERWLSEARVARDVAQFALPLSDLRLGAGDVVTIPGDGVDGSYRIDRVEQSGMQVIEAVRVESEIYEPSDAVEETVTQRPFVAPVPVAPYFLDLPLLTGDEVPHAPFVAATARPWPGSVAVFSSSSDDGYELNKLLTAPATVGLTRTTLFRAMPGVVDRGGDLRVEFANGQLSSASLDAVLNGANVAAIGDGTPGNWEIFQFADANLIAERTYDIIGRLRGQLGTDGIMPDDWPVGSTVVILDGSMRQIDLDASARGLTRHYRIGPAQRSFDDPSYTHLIEAFDGIGLRPYSPAHLRAEKDIGDNYNITWIRRTRIDGDSWQSVEVPLGEDNESYLLRVIKDGSLVREETTGGTDFFYSAEDVANDAIVVPFDMALSEKSLDRTVMN